LRRIDASPVIVIRKYPFVLESRMERVVIASLRTAPTAGNRQLVRRD
jgi:hypothetical protein